MKKVLWLMPAIGLTVTGAKAQDYIPTQSGTIAISSVDRTVTLVTPNQATTNAVGISNEELNREIDNLMANANNASRVPVVQATQNTRTVVQNFNAGNNGEYNVKVDADKAFISVSRATPVQTQLQAQSQPQSASAISSGAAPAVAARLASRAAHGKSIGRCALYVRKALQSAGYNFTPKPSAYQYAHGTLAGAGFTKISNQNYVPQVGDVVVFNRTAKNPHGHIQIYDGRGWVSDFRQPKFSPYSQHNGYTVWRDSRYLDASNNGGTMMAMND
ncbi:CHAP domain-containing protein [Moraxella oblonga]|uniref:CHAP domain-containing protein n=1 Tax=Moraxella oblonga TaxID=200413 RepID=UPI000A949B8D|nr:CHAP domain-containing protein [Moraxella oblonga]